jgi:dephospho-CoA kinase
VSEHAPSDQAGPGAAVFQIGLTGGIGAGKSTVADLFQQHGAIVLDADVAARQVVEPGTDGYAAVVAEFGPEVLRADGALDRAALAAVVFGADDRRAALNAIVHPRVRSWMAWRTAAAAAGSVVVQDIPLLVETGLAAGFDLCVVVDAPDEVRIARLVADRGMSEQEASARIAAQASRRDRLAVADVVLDNSGAPQDLVRQVDALWPRIRKAAAAKRHLPTGAVKGSTAW